MSTNRVYVDRSPRQVFDVLRDGWTYSNWVVGTSHMRAVDDAWPRPGSKLHHASGAWPLVRRDETEVEAAEPGRSLVLTARARPAGEARIEIGLEPEGDGCRVTMTEYPSSWPARWLHNPVADAVLARRNRESLARLKALVERPSRPLDQA